MCLRPAEDIPTSRYPGTVNTKETVPVNTKTLTGLIQSFSFWNQKGIAYVVFNQFHVLRRTYLTGSADHSTSARNVADVHAIAVNLDINSNPSLFILVSADGSINRAGSGTLEEKETKNRHFFIGVTDPAIFERVRSHLTEATLQRLGQRSQRQSARGAPCKLELMFQFNDRTSGRFEYLYGSESEGPPSDVSIL